MPVKLSEYNIGGFFIVTSCIHVTSVREVDEKVQKIVFMCVCAKDDRVILTELLSSHNYG